jgi:hypothetical protein
MIISRVKGGCFMIGGSAILFALNVFLTDENAMQITMLAPVQNFLFFVSIVLLTAGIYLIVTSKPCPACGEKVHRRHLDCKYCGWIFKIPRPPRR